MNKHFNLAEESARLLPIEKGRILLISLESREVKYAALRIIRRYPGELNLTLCFYNKENNENKNLFYFPRGLAAPKEIMSKNIYQQVIIIEFPFFLDKPEIVMAEAYMLLINYGLLTISLNSTNNSANFVGKLLETRGILQKVGFQEPFCLHPLGDYPGSYITARKKEVINDEIYQDLFTS